MRFLYVDSITDWTDRSIQGTRCFPVADPMQYCEDGFRPTIAPGVICEAMGQLASWLCLKQSNFTMRPVFLFADRIECHEEVHPGETLNLEVVFHDLASDSCRFSAQAFRGETLVQTLEQCAMSFVPITELEDPEGARQRFEALSSGGIRYEDAEGEPFRFHALVETVKHWEPGQAIVTQKRFAAEEPFFPDHFPRFPVTPVVILNEMIGQATRNLFGLSGLRGLRLRRIEGCKIRNFVRPGESCETRLRLLRSELREGRREFSTDAEIFKEGKRILRATWHFELEGGPNL